MGVYAAWGKRCRNCGWRVELAALRASGGHERLHLRRAGQRRNGTVLHRSQRADGVGVAADSAQLRLVVGGVGVIQ